VESGLPCWLRRFLWH